MMLAVFRRLPKQRIKEDALFNGEKIVGAARFVHGGPAVTVLQSN